MFHRWDKVVIPEVGFLFLAKQNTGHLHQNTLLWPHQLKLFLTWSLSCTGFIFVTIVSQHRPDWGSGTVITATLRQAFNSGFICYNSDTHHSLTRRYTHHVGRVVRRQWRHHNTLLKLRHKYSLQYAPDTSALVQEDKKSKLKAWRSWSFLLCFSLFLPQSLNFSNCVNTSLCMIYESLSFFTNASLNWW